MASGSQQFGSRKATRHKALCTLALALALLGSPALANTLSYDGITIADVGLTQRIVTDAVSGIALSGYDPVSYFTEPKPLRGAAAFEVIWAGAAWRFANAGNMAAFQAHPEIYAPRFGGYDPQAMATGRAVQGDPEVFAMAEGRLYLFRNAASRQAFQSDQTRLAAAATKWVDVESTLVD